MKINNLGFNKLQREYQKNKKMGQEKGLGKGDTMAISSQAKQIKELEAELKEIPDIRKDRVEKLQKQIKSGQYKVDTKALARKILSSLDKE